MSPTEVSLSKPRFSLLIKTALIFLSWKAVQSLLMGIIYYAWDSKDSPDYYTPRYLSSEWGDVDTCVLIVTWFLGQAVIIVQVVTKILSYTARNLIATGICCAVGVVSFACIGVLCAFLDEESSAFWTYVWALVLAAEVVITAVFAIVFYVIQTRTKKITHKREPTSSNAMNH
jgi:hypothetical protein